MLVVCGIPNSVRKITAIDLIMASDKILGNYTFEKLGEATSVDTIQLYLPDVRLFISGL